MNATTMLAMISGFATVAVAAFFTFFIMLTRSDRDGGRE
jgi:hypothetical protein